MLCQLPLLLRRGRGRRGRRHHGRALALAHFLPFGELFRRKDVFQLRGGAVADFLHFGAVIFLRQAGVLPQFARFFCMSSMIGLT